MRKSASTTSTVLTKIPAGKTVELISWYGKFAKVSYNGKTGYVMASYIAPVDQDMQAALDTIAVTDCYTYEQMRKDLQTFQQKYPKLVKVEVIGTSVRGKEIPVIRVGSEKAAKHVLIHGSIHGREHMTTWLIMALLDYWLDRDLASLGDICFHFIPMVNPDGVEISQTGRLPQDLEYIYKNDVKKGYTTLSMTEYAKQWKANGRGVDLNRNFDAGWKKYYGRSSASTEKYKGTAAFSEPEAQMLRDYTQRYSFGVTISYHATGSITYYEYGSDKTVNAQCKNLANALYVNNGYYLLGSDDTDAAGYKDWAIDSKKIPSLTVEIGCQNAPLDKREAYSIFARNIHILPDIAQWLK